MPCEAQVQADEHQGDRCHAMLGVDLQAHARVDRFVIRPKYLHVDGNRRRLPAQLPAAERSLNRVQFAAPLAE